MDRLFHLRAAPALLATVALLACPDERPADSPPPGRFVAVQGKRAADATKKFCEKSYPSSGPSARRYQDPPERPLVDGAGAAARGWRWINLWATWCTPCMAEIPLLGRWQRGLAKDGVDLKLELWSVDEDEALLRQALKKKLPGQIRWMRSFEDLTPFLEGMGIGSDAALPIHLLVDGAGMLRCVRVGAVHDDDYGAIKSILGGG